MDRYLIDKCKGKYRVFAELDEETNNFVKDTTFDSFGDFYLLGAGGTKIKHGVGSTMSLYVPSKQKGVRILRTIYIDNIDKEIPKENSNTTKYLENLCQSLVDSDVLVSAEVLDFEVYIEFKLDLIDYMAKLIKAKTSGANISPFSTRNLPKKKHTVPKEDLDMYNGAIEHLPKKGMGFNKDKLVADGIIIMRLNKEFKEKYKLEADNRMKFKEYIHSIGKWTEYCEFLQNAKV